MIVYANVYAVYFYKNSSDRESSPVKEYMVQSMEHGRWYLESLGFKERCYPGLFYKNDFPYYAVLGPSNISMNIPSTFEELEHDLNFVEKELSND